MKVELDFIPKACDHMRTPKIGRHPQVWKFDQYEAARPAFCCVRLVKGVGLFVLMMFNKQFTTNVVCLVFVLIYLL